MRHLESISQVCRSSVDRVRWLTSPYRSGDTDGLDMKTNDRVAISGPTLKEARYGGRERGPAVNTQSDVGA